MTDNLTWQVKIIDRGFKTSRDLYIFRRTPNGTLFLQGDTIVTVQEGEEYPKATLQLEPEQLQTLADELAQVGYKPLKGFIEGKLEATERHLEDMRRLVFEQPNLIDVKALNTK